MTEEVYLGIDTSCYTTSVLFMDRQGNGIAEARRVLRVKPGGCGLQQSEMLYQHIRNLPELLEEALQGHSFSLRGIGVSARPRPRTDSYMPAFLAGLGCARSLAALNRIPVWQISHQENHLEAALWSAGGPDSDRFFFLHASGGTTDLLIAEKTEKGYKLSEIGSSLDLHAGQFVDRVGVALGLPFPAGPALEKLAEEADKVMEIPVSVHKTQVSFSGPCTAVIRRIKAGDVPPAVIAASVQWGLAETFLRMIRNAAAEHNVKQVILAGGVSSNLWIRKHMETKLAKRNIRIWVPESRYSGDNAAGCAAYAYRQGERHG